MLLNITDLPAKMQPKIRMELCDTPGLAPFCWNWFGYVETNGYGRMYLKGERTKKRLCHRVAYESLVGPVPDGLELDHLCRNTRCCNPDHLEAVPHVVNQRRNSAQTRTRCKRGGHPLFGDNLFLYTNREGYQLRQCRACRAEAQRRHYWRQKVVAS